jgi:hypothetical protein
MMIVVAVMTATIIIPMSLMGIVNVFMMMRVIAHLRTVSLMFVMGMGMMIMHLLMILFL